MGPEVAADTLSEHGAANEKLGRKRVSVSVSWEVLVGPFAEWCLPSGQACLLVSERTVRNSYTNSVRLSDWTVAAFAKNAGEASTHVLGERGYRSDTLTGNVYQNTISRTTRP